MNEPLILIPFTPNEIRLIAKVIREIVTQSPNPQHRERESQDLHKKLRVYCDVLY